MEIEEIRRANINFWAEKLGRDVLAQKMGYKDTVYINQLCGGHGSFGKRTARKAEQALGLDRGWIDQVHEPSDIDFDFAAVSRSAIGDRIKTLRLQAGLTHELIALLLVNCTPITVRYWESGMLIPSNGELTGLANALKTSSDFIINGADNKAPDGSSPPANEEFRISPTGITKGLRRWEASQNIPEFKHKKGDLVPLISWVQAGSWGESPDIYAVGDAEEWMYCPGTHSSGTFALRVVGDSMISPSPHERGYPPGIIIFVDPERVPLTGSRVIARAPNSSEVTFKVFATDGGIAYLRPLNPQYPTIQMQEGTVICGVVIGSYWPE